MSQVCELCGKGKTVGGHITRRGLAKKKGGIGTHVVKNTKRTFSPNLQNVRVRNGGGVRRMKVCTACIRKGAVVKA
jgi:large subunit ribosomal protein L28